MVIALLTAAGSGSRMGQDIPKQFMHIDDKPLIIHTMEVFQRHPSIDAIVVVTIDSWKEVVKAYAKQFGITKLRWIASGGETGQDSIFNGLEAIKSDIDSDSIIMVHDGNRPMVSTEIISDSIATYKKYGSAVAAIPCVEVVFVCDNKVHSKETIDRNSLLRTQTPHTYSFEELYNSHLSAQRQGIKNTAASCELMKALGKESYFSLGSEENIKITTRDDLMIFKALLHTKKDDWIK